MLTYAETIQTFTLRMSITIWVKSRIPLHLHPAGDDMREIKRKVDTHDNGYS